MAADISAALTDVDAAGMARLLASGGATASEIATQLIHRIERDEPRFRAWAQFDAALVLAQAQASDRRRRSGRALSALDGVPIAFKDNIDTADWPTEMGSPIHAGRRPREDAAIVIKVKQLGMVILGKTVTTPFGMNAPAPTRNPADPAHTLGASSVGSAAAIAAGMVPLTINTQNTSSTTRPASYAGVYAFKPQHGALPMRGALALSPLVAHLALMAGSLDDLALLSQHLLDLGMPPARRRRVALVHGPWWNRVTPDGDLALRDFARDRGIADTVALPACFADAIEAHLRIIAADVAVTLADEYAQARDELPPDARAWIEDGLAMPAVDYARALRLRERMSAALSDAMAGIDALITLSTPGAAPLSETGLGDGTFSMPWTFCGVPTMSLPLLENADGLPIGLQVIARPSDHHGLFAVCRDLIARPAR